VSDNEWQENLVKQLTELARPEGPNRKVLAHLRRGLEAPVDYTLGHVGWLFRRVPDFALSDAVLVAGLFAWVKGAWQQTSDVNFGSAFGNGLTIDEKKQREKRFIDLLDTDMEELPYKLRQAVTLIAQDTIAFDWTLLIRHLGQWSHPDRWVQRDWARGFWSASETETDADEIQPVSN
jgi:CRISPR system Cascade subunit CasB